MRENHIKDLSLWEEGEKFYSWSQRNMPVLAKIRERFGKEKSLSGVKIAACLHITAETANLLLTLKEGGAEVLLCASNPLSTQDRITAFLAKNGITVYALHGEDIKTYFDHCNWVLDAAPNIVIDDGGDLTRLLHAERRDMAKHIIGGLEETTTGVIRIKSLEAEGKLTYPIIAINDAKTKHMFDNRYGTGQSTIDSILRATNILLGGKKFVVAGFGMCGRGVAMRAAGMGADVIVTEVDPVKALEAVMEGYRVMPMIEAAKVADVIITVTGDIDILTKEHFAVMKDNVLLANSGHFNVEINLNELKDMSKSYTKLRSNIEEYTLENGHRLIVLGEGRLVNLVAAEGHPSSVMDMSFANQALGCEYLIKNKENLEIKVFNMPAEIDNDVAAHKLESMGIAFDKLSARQEKYLNSWEEGT